MQKKYCSLILAFAFVLGTIVASLPPVKASPGVRFYVWNSVTGDNIYPGTTDYFSVQVWIDSPVAWDDTPEGIVGYGLSVRVDPRALMVLGADKVPSYGGFLEDFLRRHMLYWFQGYRTSLLMGPIDTEAGTIIDIAEYIMGYETLGVGAGGGLIPLLEIWFFPLSDTLATPIDIAGRWDAVLKTIEVTAYYTTPDGVDHYVDVLDDGYYVAQTPDTMWFDSPPAGFPSGDPRTSDWHEIWPTTCPWWSLNDWVDTDGNGALSVSDQIFMEKTEAPYEAHWFHVDWMNPAGASGDGSPDLRVTKILPIPEFPLGVALMIALAPAIPVVYLWRTRKKVIVK